jgi:hypothetical protein
MAGQYGDGVLLSSSLFTLSLLPNEILSLSIKNTNQIVVVGRRRPVAVVENVETT